MSNDRKSCTNTARALTHLRVLLEGLLQALHLRLLLLAGHEVLVELWRELADLLRHLRAHEVRAAHRHRYGVAKRGEEVDTLGVELHHGRFTQRYFRL